MPFPLLGLLPSILKSVAKVSGLSVVADAADALQKAQLTPEQQAELQESLQRHEAAMKELSVEEMKTAMSESLAMLSSADKYVSRARPTGLYAFYAVSAAIAVGMLCGVHVDATAILTVLTPLGGVSGVYVYARTKEKLSLGGQSGVAE